MCVGYLLNYSLSPGFSFRRSRSGRSGFLKHPHFWFRRGRCENAGFVRKGVDEVMEGVCPLALNEVASLCWDDNNCYYRLRFAWDRFDEVKMARFKYDVKLMCVGYLLKYSLSPGFSFRRSRSGRSGFLKRPYFWFRRGRCENAGFVRNAWTKWWRECVPVL